ncbi:hypothetical protein ACFLZM_05885 [Thermodesulfobacteriota bacterium]
MIKRALEKIVLRQFNRGKVIQIMGPRQVDKTTLAQIISEIYGESTLWLNG